MSRTWSLSLSLSIGIHLIALFGLPTLRSPQIFPKENVEKKEIKILSQDFEKINKIQKPETTSPLDKPPPYIENLVKKTIFDYKRNFLDKPQLKVPLKEVVFASLDESKKIQKTPAYMNYYKMIRERIKKNAYHYYESEDSGIVYVSFVVLENGKLYKLHLLDKSTKSKELIKTALRSIRDADPFPPFPEELAYPKLQFNVSIHFKNN
jgi:TonB family protein